MTVLIESRPSTETRTPPSDTKSSGAEAVEFKNSKQIESLEDRRERIKGQSISRQIFRSKARSTRISGFGYVITPSSPGVDRSLNVFRPETNSYEPVGQDEDEYIQLFLF